MSLTLSFGTPVARKEYDCEHCIEPIVKGERHVTWSNVDDGRVYTLRVHTECSAAIDRYIAAFRLTADDLLCDGHHTRGGFCRECEPVEAAPHSPTEGAQS